MEIPIGEQGIAFDRLDLDAWADDYKTRNGRPGKAMGGRPPWDRRFRQDSSSGNKSGISKRQSKRDEFEKALAQVTSKKAKGI
jgi:hypothetical protein